MKALCFPLSLDDIMYCTGTFQELYERELDFSDSKQTEHELLHNTSCAGDLD
jgi:hypothetical protein